MKDKVKIAWEWTAEAVETACGWALFAALAYGAMFVDVLGRGSLWNSAKALVAESRQPASTVPLEFTRVRVPARASALSDRERTERAIAEDRILFALEPQDSDKTIEVVVAAPRVREMVDTPADPQAGTTWHKKLKGKMRTFTVYGDGEQSSSASASVSAGVPAAAPESIAAAPVSAYKAGAASEARPGILGRVSRVSAGPADSVRNIR